jgi:ABC-2 type transport system ATP-binding protein
MCAAIQTYGLTKRYGETLALDSLDLTVREGEVYGYLGPNGAGKTTTIRLLLGLHRASEGRAELFGIDAWKDPVTAHRRVAYVAGEPALWPQMTAAETFEFLMSLHGGVDVAYRDELVERFKLDADKKVRALSKGNRQKVQLVAALATRADLLLLDEPTSGLDPLMEAAFRDTVHEAKERGQTIFLSSHILSEVDALCDRVGILRNARLVDEGTLDELRHLSAPTVEVRFARQPPSDDALDQLGEHHDHPADAVHEARKDLKKLRSLLRMVGPAIGSQVYRRENARFRDLGRELSGARDAEVKLQTLEGLRQRSGNLDGLDGYVAALEKERAGAEVSGSTLARAISELEDSRECVADWALGGWTPTGDGLLRGYRRGRKALAKARVDPSDATVHEWRKRSKDLWYHLRIVSTAWPEVLESVADQAHKLSELLGDHHDLAVLAEDAAGRPPSLMDGARSRLIAAIRKRQKKLLADALPLGTRLYAERPKAFGDRIDAYWRLKGGSR